MTIMSLPPFDAEPWPTLGPDVCEWMESSLSYGPGDMSKRPYRLLQEQRAFVYRLYEVHPYGHRDEGRRRFRKGALVLRKGSMKTELAAAIAAAELAPDCPVRCDGFKRDRGLWVPIGKAVTDPYIPMLAYTEEQSEDLAYGALYAMLQNGPKAHMYDIGLDRIMRATGDGVAKPMATAPDSRDGARTSFQHFDEPHRMTLNRQKEARLTMAQNLLKRPMAEPWELETTTAHEPGGGSVAEETMDEATAIHEGRTADPKFFFFYRHADYSIDISDPEGCRAAVEDASGPELSSWRNIQDIADTISKARINKPSDLPYLERVWLGRIVQGSNRPFNMKAHAKNYRADYDVPHGALSVLGFDGSRTRDSTALVLTEVETGFQKILGIWERPLGRQVWEVPRGEVDAAVTQAFDDYDIWRMYADPYHWDSELADWAGRYDDKVVVEFNTTRVRLMGNALKAYADAIELGLMTHDGNEALTRHLGNAVKQLSNFLDDEREPIWIIQKERPDSPKKIDAVMAGCLSWEARTDAIREGATPQTVASGFFV